ncbi:type II secretion system protein [Dechloromonas sp. ARDL1]|uniref:type II secretion system protein n=1 Tax=Dechloromonas sp. ARDL1 TaxID=3322121 RepID=UPI003DA73F77
MQTRRLSGGFSLVEMTIVFVIMSLVLTVGVSALTTQYETVRLSTTRKNHEIIQQALTNFISRNGRLPCPAVRTLAPGSVGYGVEASNPGVCTGAASVGTSPAVVVTGIVPFVSLGLNEDIASDGYFNRYTYQVVVSATAPTAPGGVQMPAGMRGYITVHSGTPTTVGLAPAGNQTNFCPLGNYNPCAAVVVIVSHGKNGLGAFTPSGTRIAMPTSADEQANTDDDGAFVRRDQIAGGTNDFDDLLLALTPNDLLDQLTKNGTVKDARAVLNATFDAMLGATVAATTGNSFPGSPNRCYNVTTPTGIFYDPWGTQITSTIGSGSPLSICAASPPTGIAITFNSQGPDGDGGSSTDDIKRQISTGELQQYLAKTGF